MSDEKLTIGADIEGARRALDEMEERVRRLRDQFKGSSVAINREMQRTARAIELLRIPLTDAKKAMNEKAVAVQKSKNEMQALGVTIDQYNTKINKLNEAQKSAVEGFISNTVVLEKAKEEYKEISDEVDNYTRKLQLLKLAKGEGVSAVENFNKGLSEIGKTARTMAGVFGVGLGIHGVVSVLRNATNAIMEFENAQKQLEAVSGANARQMSELSRQAIQLGSATRFGATGVSQLQVQLARMGFTVGEIGRMTEGIIMLATATQEDLGKAAETVANVLNAFNLDARETGRVVDVMAQSFTQSALDLERFRQAIKYIGPIANDANFSIENTSTLLAKLADAGIYGSLAGTSLRNVLSQLADSSSALTQQVGFSVKSFDDFIAAMKVLQSQGVNLENIFEIMDRRAASAFSIILKGVDGLEQFQRMLEQAGGAADRMAKIQMESLTYKTLQAKAAWDGFVIALDKGSNIISGILKSILDGFNLVMSTAGRWLNSETKLISRHINTMNTLVDTILNEQISLEARERALQRLKAEYPEYFGMLDITIDKLDGLTDAQEKAAESMIKHMGFVSATEALDKYNNKLDRVTAKLDRFIGQREALSPEWKWTVEFDIWHAQRRVDKFTNSVKYLGQQLEFLQYQLPKEEFIAYKDELGEIDAHAKTFIDGFMDLNKSLSLQPGISEIEALQGAFNEAETDLLAYVATQQALQEWAVEGGSIWLIHAANIEAANRAYEKMGEIYRKLKYEISESAKPLEAHLRLQQRLAEINATIATNDIALEKRLAKIKFDFAHKLAALEADEIKRRLMKQVADREYAMTLQTINRRILQEEHEKNDKIRRDAEDLNKFLLNILGERKRAELSAVADRDNYVQRHDVELSHIQSSHEDILAEIQRRADREIEILREKEKEKLSLVGNDPEETERVKKETEDDTQAVLDKQFAEELVARTKHNNDLKQLYLKHNREILQIQKEASEERLAEFEYEQEKQAQIFGSKRTTDSERNAFERQQHEERIQFLIREREELIRNMETEASILEVRANAGDEVAQGELGNIRREIAKAKRELGLFKNELENPDFDTQAWDEMRDAIKKLGQEITKALRQMLAEKEKFAKHERSILDRRVAEGQRALDTEIKLGELGHAASVEARRKELAMTQIARDKALKAEEEAMKRRMQLDAIIQGVNILTAVTNVLKVESLKGLPGIALAAGGAAAIYALYKSAKQISKQTTTTYEQGGSFMLKGPSHARGGMLLAPGHEAQGGEMVSVYKRSAATKHGAQIRRFEEAINNNRPFTPDNFNIFAENKDLKAMRKIMEREQVEYRDGFTVIKRGNHTTICRRN